MTGWRSTVATLGVAALVAVPTTSAAARAAGPDVAPSTRANTLTAMHGEAYAYAIYTAYAGQAARTGKPRVAHLFTRTAGVELREHFAGEAELIGLVHGDAANLRDAIDGETYEHTTMYPQYAKQAIADRCTAAADLFTEIAADEGGHAAAFTTALRALTDRTVSVPAPPAVDPVEIIASTPACTGRTLDNLEAAMHGEAFAYAKYSLYAAHARRSGRPALAALFGGTAQVELREHFAGEAMLAGVVGGNAANLRHAITGETFEAKTMYPDFAAQAAAAGDRRAARLFRRIGHQEWGHAHRFTAALHTL
ncbi:MAG TPA: ferritin family protein [Frankiaceae bacterium]|nr:ferritin family protein [Frankiaceae bacterium]